MLFALTMLLMTLMTLMTLSLGSKVKHRMELQTLADTAAYSNAVATARTMNAMAVMNRVQVAHTASTLGTLSLISWSTLYWQDVQNAVQIFKKQQKAYEAGLLFTPSCDAGVNMMKLALKNLKPLATEAFAKLWLDTMLFDSETQPRWMAAQAIYRDQQVMHENLLGQLNDPGNGFGAGFSRAANIPGITALTPMTAGLVIPISARQGDNIAASGQNMPWWKGATVLETLGEFKAARPTSDPPLRFPIQDVYRFDHRRILAGRVEPGRIKVGDRLTFSPSNKTSAVKSIERWNAPARDFAVAGESIGITLTNQVFVERGAVAALESTPPYALTCFKARPFGSASDHSRQAGNTGSSWRRRRPSARSRNWNG